MSSISHSFDRAAAYRPRHAALGTLRLDGPTLSTAAVVVLYGALFLFVAYSVMFGSGTAGSVFLGP